MLTIRGWRSNRLPYFLGVTMQTFKILIDSLALHYIAKELDIPTNDAVVVLHDMSLEHIDIVLHKAKQNTKVYSTSKRKRILPNSNIGIFFSSSHMHGEIEIRIGIVNNKRLTFDADKIKDFVVENILLKEDL